MNAQETNPEQDPRAGQAAPGGAPSEEELRAAYEAELSRITVTDMMAQAAVSLLNIAARRLSPASAPSEPQGGTPDSGGRDLEQVRDGIDGVRALLDILERRIPADELRPLRDAVSQLQMAYAAEVQAATSPQAGGEGGEGGPGGVPEGSEEKSGQGGPGPAQSSGRLWVPGS